MASERRFGLSWRTAIVFGCIGLIAGVVITRIAAAPATSTGWLESDKATLRGIIREEVQAAASREASPLGSPDLDAVGQLAAEERAPYDTTVAMINQRIAQGSWTPEDRDQLRSGTASLPLALQRNLIKPLLIALNDKKVQWTGHGTPF